MASVVSRILASTRNRISFSFIRPNVGDNALTTIKDLNQVVDQINGAINYRGYIFQVGISGGEIPRVTATTISNGRYTAGECNECLGGSPGCGSCGSEKDQKVGVSIFSGVARVGTGHYRFTLDKTVDSIAAMRTIQVLVEPVAPTVVAGETTTYFVGGVSVVKNLSPESGNPYIDIYTMNTNTHTLSDSILSGAIIEFRIF